MFAAWRVITVVDSWCFLDKKSMVNKQMLNATKKIKYLLTKRKYNTH